MGDARRVRIAIETLGVSVYDDPVTADSSLFYAPDELESLLREELVGREDLAGVPIRTRSFLAKRLVCSALGYEPPKSFRRVNPRLPHPTIDVYVQQSNNLQIWNADIDARRRYVILILGEGRIVDVHVIAGADLAQFDRTGTLTSKFQASRIDGRTDSKLVSAADTPRFIERLSPSDRVSSGSPVARPESGRVLTVGEVYRRLLPMVGSAYTDPGIVQERNRGTVVHREACARLGADGFADNGQFPDILSQLVEVKLQLARTVDLGLELPSSDTPLASANGLLGVRDVRYTIFYADRDGAAFKISGLVVVTGADFFKEYRRFGGLAMNRKLQLKLPPAWFER